MVSQEEGNKSEDLQYSVKRMSSSATGVVVNGLINHKGRMKDGFPQLPVFFFFFQFATVQKPKFAISSK